jgi:hypothetical protein
MEYKSELEKIIMKHWKSVNIFIAKGDLDRDLEYVLFDRYSEDMPYGTMKGRTGDPYEFICDRFYTELKEEGYLDEEV